MRSASLTGESSALRPIIALLALASPLCVGCRTYRTDHVQRVAQLGVCEGRDVRLLEKAHRADPADLGIVIAYTRALEEGGLLERAQEVVDSSLEERREARLLARRAQLVPEEAEGLAREALELDPSYPLAQLLLGRALREKGDLDDSEATLASNAAMNQTSAEAHFELARTQAAMGKRLDAYGSVLTGLLVENLAGEDPPWWVCQFVADLYVGHPRWEQEAQRLRELGPVPTDESTAGFYEPMPSSEDVALLPRPWISGLAIGLAFETWGPDPLVVVGVQPESMAAEAGMQPGDRLLSIEGVEFRSLDDFFNWMERGDHPDELRFAFRRDGDELVGEALQLSGEAYGEIYAGVVREAQAALEEGEYHEALRQFRTLRESLAFFFNREIEFGYLSALIGAEKTHEAIACVDLRLQTAPRDPALHWLRAHACFMERDRHPFGEEWTRWQNLASASLQQARQEAPSSGFLWSYGLAHGNLPYTAASKETLLFLEESFERALALGEGGAALETFAAQLDELHQRSLEEEKRERSLILARAFASSLASSVASTATSASSGNSTPSGIGITRPNPVSNQQFSQLQSATYGW